MAVRNVEAVEQITTNDDREEVNNITEKDYQWVHIYFHSTSSCNIITTNAFNKCVTTDIMISWGEDKIKHYWGIDTNGYHHIYLGKYSRMD